MKLAVGTKVEIDLNDEWYEERGVIVAVSEHRHTRYTVELDNGVKKQYLAEELKIVE